MQTPRSPRVPLFPTETCHETWCLEQSLFPNPVVQFVTFSAPFNLTFLPLSFREKFYHKSSTNCTTTTTTIIISSQVSSLRVLPSSYPRFLRLTATYCNRPTMFLDFTENSMHPAARHRIFRPYSVYTRCNTISTKLLQKF